MATLELDTPVQYVKGVGPARAMQLEAMGIRTVGDLIEHFPMRYDLRPESIPIEDLREGEIATVMGGIVDVKIKYSPRGTNVVADVEDGTGLCRVWWFNASYLKDKLFIHQQIRLTGKVGVRNKVAQFSNPRFKLADDAQDLFAIDIESFEPVYPATGKLPSPQIAKAIRTALPQVESRIHDFLPEPIRERRSLPPRRTAVCRYHHPTREEDVPVARNRLAYDELFLMQVAVQLRRHHAAHAERAMPMPVSEHVDQRIRARIPFTLTPGQDKAVGEIVSDLAKEKPMNRLLQADVGAGKTAVALYAALAVIANGQNVLLIAPTEILAEQHYKKIARYLEGSQVRIELMVGALTARQREAARKRAAEGEIDLLIGTHALLESQVQMPDIGLVIVDEQHRFGVAQRATLRHKGRNVYLVPHYLVLTATPIPRTLAMTLFGDLDVSTIEGLPPGRADVSTRLVLESDIDSAWGFVRERIAAGEQGYIVYPLVEESEAMPLKAATAEFESLQAGPLAGCRLALLHGRMKPAEKDDVMNRFRAGEVDLLVATTVVEVGVDVPNATIMMIHHAERFGLSQLHQLRGRVGRGTKESWCLLVADPKGETAKARLNILCQTRDGFRIAEEDLKIRGPGEVLGTRQHGLPTFKVADLLEDLGLSQQARDDAVEIVQADPTLSQADHAGIRTEISRRFHDLIHFVDVA